jgi:hypothetical protein
MSSVAACSQIAAAAKFRGPHGTLRTLRSDTRYRHLVPCERCYADRVFLPPRTHHRARLYVRAKHFVLTLFRGSLSLISSWHQYGTDASNIL